MPQNLKTEPQSYDDADELPSLTAQQQKFVEGIVSGKTASDAYRAAYDCSNSMASTVWARASELRNDRKVAAWISAAQKACMGSTIVTLDDHLHQLERLREIALEKGNVGAAVLAEHHRGKARGHYVEQIRDVTDHDPQHTLREIALHSPELAQQMAKEANVPFTPAVPQQGERVH
jgi:phage terminase small subunit